MSPTAPGRSTEATVRLHSLTMVAEDDAVMVGRPDIGSYALFPREGAQALRMLDAGSPVSAVAEWYEQACGEILDVADFLSALEDLQFLQAEGEDKAAIPKLRWQRLGRWMFSWPAWICYATLIVVAAVAMIQNPSLRPTYQHIFFTQYLSLIPIVIAVSQLPCVLIHEAFHALAGRRLGLPSVLRISRRLFYVVAETRLDSLLSVPRRQRYLPFLAGMLADLLQISTLTLLAVVLNRHGIPQWCPKLCLAIAFSCVLRVIWQFMFYLETDLYYVVSTALRCADLQNATRFYIKNRIRLLLHRPSREPDLDWSDRDHRVARWYALFMLAGYGFSLFSLVWAAIPTVVKFTVLIIERFTGSRTPTTALIDATSFIALNALQWGLVAYVVARDRRARLASNSTRGA
jgi:hypothetical protein